jgi:hypothetical protein
VNVDQRVIVHNLGMMDRNEAHAIYISSQSIDIINMTYRLKTVVPATQVKQCKLVMVVLL